MKKSVATILAVALALILAGASSALAQAKKEVTVKTTPSPDLSRGKDLYESHCGSCHGKDGKGNGPVAAALKATPTDLTQLAKKNQGTFDEIHVMTLIDGQKAISAHGTREMPVWGTRFRQAKGQMISNLNVFALMKYIESLQER